MSPEGQTEEMTLPFIVWIPVPSKTTPGKVDKFPVDHRTLTVANAHDQAIWTDRATATAAAARMGRGAGVGVVITPPYWFLDLDGAFGADGWSAPATLLCTRLSGAYCEVSYSGRGLHLIGRGTLPPHGTKNHEIHAELYTSGRFCALTGTHARGSMEADLTAAVAAVAAEFFPPGAGAGAVVPSDWTTAPREGWNGPADDDELIARALNSTSSGAAFGGKATFRQLWTADADALARVWPAVGDRPFDASAADAALVQHLAFWTGADCERMARLLARSGLAREKHERPDYIHRTVARAASMQRDVYRGPLAVAAPAQGAASATTASTYGLLTASDLPAHFEGAVYIEDMYAAAVPDGSILEPSQFRSSSRYGGHRFMVSDGGTRPIADAWKAFIENELYKPPYAHSLCFRPELPSRVRIEEEGRVLFNSYVPIVTPSKPGDASPFLNLLKTLLPNEYDRATLLAFMARVVQSPGVKLQWAPVLQGVDGNGKTFILSVMERAIGQRYSHFPKASDVHNKFNPWLAGKIFIGIEEIHIKERREALDAIKPLITNKRLELQGKMANQVMTDNRANFMLTTNHRDAIPKTENDRRYAMYFTAQQEAAHLARDGLTGDYFPVLHRWADAGGYAICTDYLRHHAIPAALDPAGAMHRAPVTSTTHEAIEAGRGPAEAAIQEAIETEEVGFRGGWISSMYLSALLDARRIRLSPNQWDALVASLGYHHPRGLPGGRLNASVQPDGKRSRIWVKAGSIPDRNLTDPKEIAAVYSAANAVTGGVAAIGKAG